MHQVQREDLQAAEEEIIHQVQKEVAVLRVVQKVEKDKFSFYVLR